MRVRSLSLAAALTLIGVGAACGPPKPPPMSAPNWQTGQMVHESRDLEGNVLCRAIAEVEVEMGVIRASGARPLTTFSDVVVRGPGAPGAPCRYLVWSFGLKLHCEDGSQYGCGTWWLPTPDGDVTTARQDLVFRSVPEGARLTVTFIASWGVLGNHYGSVTSPVIRCDATRCKFYV